MISSTAPAKRLRTTAGAGAEPAATAASSFQIVFIQSNDLNSNNLNRPSRFFAGGQFRNEVWNLTVIHDQGHVEAASFERQRIAIINVTPSLGCGGTSAT
ncbi:MAG: hypothetical protein WCH40_12675, partial [Verrucomicrobiales bacterium]